MPAAPLPPNETERLAALHALGILDTPPEERFDRITRTARRLFGVESAVVTLVDANRQWFKSCVGLDDAETSRAISFCAYAILGDDILVIPDARADERFAANANVTGPPFIRFYAGKPVVGPSGHTLGTLCLIDSRPRQFGEDDHAALTDLAAMVETEFAAFELTRATVELHVAEARLRAIMDGAAEGIAAVDAEGRIMFTNPSAWSALGYAEGELIGRSFHATVHHARADGSPYPVVDSPLHATLADGSSQHCDDEVFWRKDGTGVPVEYNATAIVEDGVIAGAVITWSDISERRELDRLKDEFVSSVSHELRTPLTSIKGYVEALQDGDAGELNEQQQRFLGVVARNATRLNALIGDLLTLSRLRAARGIAESEPVALVPLSTHVVEELVPLADERGVALEGELEPVCVEGDARQLAQAITNLVSNAIKFSPSGSRVVVRTCTNGGDALLEVVDRGIGIAADEVAELGSRFFRATSARGTEGTGLGLAITREIAESHGGRLEVESALGAGSTFRLRLPLVTEAAAT